MDSIILKELIMAVATGKKDKCTLSEAERNAIMDTRHSDDSAPEDELLRVRAKQLVGGLHLDRVSVPRKDSADATFELQIIPWKGYIKQGHANHVRCKAKGEQSGKVRRSNMETRDPLIVSYARTLLDSYDRGKWASMAAKKFKVSVVKARNVIKVAGLYENLSSKKHKKVPRKRI